ncbi:hypothetical protein GJAV_G00000600 [Gymnothorax javanicus]|nr:hypothetical protein GJAV_G00000600 [Gymnothorax javanicus]
MKILLTLALACALLSQVSSLECYQCSDSSCSNNKGTTKCGGNQTKCASKTLYSFTLSGAPEKEHKQSVEKGCVKPVECIGGYINFDRMQMNSANIHCCDTDLCNHVQLPALTESTPNGLKCYTCIEKNCSHAMECRGPEDRCISTTVFGPSVMKGCASGSYCSGLCKFAKNSVNCCKGNMCNDDLTVGQKSEGNICDRALRIGQSILFLILLPVTSFILFS